ncbi:MAG: hypothetical protein QGG36_00170 [Pirellulaceae bacterium]|jgi:hypothetical protein|nr:hypothetical protein [Pirellulaceae bacterium]MDP7014190.1 hypothetical protein [Pirellulaceae bacterium]
MGHDITAMRPGVEYEELAEQYDLDNNDDGWFERYQEFERLTKVACNRRSATSPLNQVLYLALGVMDEAYAGCSGNGAALNITLDQFRTAAEVLETKDFANMEREPNMADTFLDNLRAEGNEVVEYAEPPDVESEKNFVQLCIEFLESTGQKSIEVKFD